MSTVDAELKAIRRLITELEGLDADAQERVLAYMWSRYPAPSEVSDDA